MAELSERHGFDPLGGVHYVNPVNLNEADVATISGHRDLNPTACPGDRLYDDMTAVRAAVSAAMSEPDDPPDDPPGDDQASAVRVGDLDGSSVGLRGTWTATVTATVVDGAGQAVAGAALTGSWDGEAAWCTTDETGRCDLDLPGLRKKQATVTFTVSGISADGLHYDPAANGDPDGDSDGTTIVVSKP